MAGVGAECGEAEAIVLLDYSKDFLIRGRRFCRLGEIPPSYLQAVLAAAKSIAGMTRSCDKNPNVHAGRGKSRERGRLLGRPPTSPQNNRSRGLLYIFAGAGTLCKNASAN
jgi:hypothetical protein